MKKIYVILAFVFILGFLGTPKASGQIGCEVCANYGLYQYCYVLRFEIPGCDSVRAVFCYDASQCPHSITIQVVELEFNPECEDQVWDYLHNWVRQHTYELCGNKPCDDPPPTTIYFSVPICGEVNWIGSIFREIIKAHPGACDKRCTFEYKVCKDYQNNRTNWQLVGKYITGNGNCNFNPYGNTYLTGGITVPPDRLFLPSLFWQIECTQILSVNCN